MPSTPLRGTLGARQGNGGYRERVSGIKELTTE